MLRPKKNYNSEICVYETWKPKDFQFEILLSELFLFHLNTDLMG